MACWQRPAATQRQAALDALIGVHEQVAAHRGEAVSFRLQARAHCRAVSLLADRPPAEIAATLGQPLAWVTQTLDDLREGADDPGPARWLDRAAPGLAPRLAEEGLLTHQGLLLAQRPGVLYMRTGVWAIPAERLPRLRAEADALRAEVEDLAAALRDEAGVPTVLAVWFGVADLCAGEDVVGGA